MPPKLKHLSGNDVIKIMGLFEFSVYSQKGSHVKLRRITGKGGKQTLTIPRHKEMDRGTLKAILRQASKYIPESELTAHFYSE